MRYDIQVMNSGRWIHHSTVFWASHAIDNAKQLAKAGRTVRAFETTRYTVIYRSN